ncbi:MULTISPECIES: relaxase/mobilization nuclease domain-containing protein [Bifidobacterium]|uniref:Mobilization protein n=2 Tax=Bifidobacterium TaxID=1678 RepID=A0A261FNH9_9BIFI|nr:MULTISPECIES: relaxase/mobilization nuclease domain-containing protein [Bifidobacterium]OZG60714.1 mobilization protein [Bifidobacterium lemurum]OZG69612.1 mobilization protein [Bifidobacterium eulemuris]QOL32271.1 relaxase/mobilization nuclease domain-containing protein [Bifidobacterium eulemuris]QOL35231.1 relaxase/mobilization nuclease domain-containing protein [Bifidobacterium lemurum]
MAVVTMGRKVKTRYTSATPLADAISYVIDRTKTEDGALVSSSYSTERHDGERLARPMEADLRAAPQGIRRDTVWAIHLKHSFAPDDPVTAEQVHELGVRLAEEITGGDFKFVVATHTNRPHLHNHLIICAAQQMEPHLHMRLPKDIIDQWRQISDRLCLDANLSVIDHPETVQDRRGMSFAEIYEQAKGKGVKAAMRTTIDLAAANSHSFDEFRGLLEAAGVKVEARGAHLTYTLLESGFKVRDNRLGEAYSMGNVMARMARTAVVPISFNSSLIEHKDGDRVTVWLPGAKRQKKITIPMDRIVRAGSTWRAYLSDEATQIVTDRRGIYEQSLPARGLYQWFGRPTESLGKSAETKLDVRAGVSDAQRRYYVAQGYRIDRLREAAKALDAATRWTREAGGDADKGIEILRERLRDEHAMLQASVIALADAIDNGTTEAQVEAREEMTLRETRVAQLEDDLGSIERHAARTRDMESEERKRERDRTVKRGHRL